MRYIKKYIIQDLKKKMVFVGGPRQVGKTTLAQDILKTHFQNARYFNWDYDEDRQDIIHKRWSKHNSLLIFDELHKFPNWKNWIKGIYDVSKNEHSFLVTGSARLDIYKQGGDSLLGRYHYWRLHPFTLNETPPNISKESSFDRLMTVGGFPEPFFDFDEREARRWRRERFDRIIREDIRDLESVKKVQQLSLFLDSIRYRVSSNIALSNIAQDIQISYKTAKHWLEILEKMYITFSIYPFVKSSLRSILKPPKVYFFDNGDVIGDKGTIFENLVATSILKKLHFLEDKEGYRYKLYYIRDKEGREVDFAIIKENQLIELVEVKYSDTKISRSLIYYANKLMPQKAVQIIATLKNPYTKGNIEVTNPFQYFQDNDYN